MNNQIINFDELTQRLRDENERSSIETRNLRNNC